MRTWPPEKSIAAFTVIELLIVITTLAIVAAIMLPRLARRPHQFHGFCTNNLKQIGMAFQTWALDNNDRFPMQTSVTNGGTLELVSTTGVSVHFSVMSNELSTPRVLVCPADENRTPATNFTTDLNDKKVSYFVVVNAAETNATMLLSGDRNITNGFRLGKSTLLLVPNSPARWTHELHHDSASQPLGNVLFSDGSVQQLNNSGLQSALQRSGMTNRLAMP
jgi:competence protein ComGC